MLKKIPARKRDKKQESTNRKERKELNESPRKERKKQKVWAVSNGAAQILAGTQSLPWFVHRHLDWGTTTFHPFCIRSDK